MDGILVLVLGNGGGDTLDAKDGDDNLYNGGGADRLYGGDQADRLEDRSGPFLVIDGGLNNWTIFGDRCTPTAVTVNCESAL